MKHNNFQKESITLKGAVGMGTGVMIGAGIFALLGQVAEITGALFPLSFITGAIITAFSAYTYAKMANSYPSAGGIGMFFVKAYGKGTVAASASLLMAFSMIINQSLVARTFGTYTLQLFNTNFGNSMVQVLGVGLLVFAFFINISGNNFIQSFTSVISLLKIVGIFVFAIAALVVANFSLDGVVPGSSSASDQPALGFVASLALTILAFKGFTTITNNGAEIVNPHKNISKAIILSISICVILYVFVAWAVGSSLSIDEIIAAKDYALAEAARPALGGYGLWFTVGIAILATITVIITSMFAVSRMATMLSDMKLIPYIQFKILGNLHRNMLVYITALAIILTLFFDLSRIASLGAIFYLFMDILFQWGVLKRLQNKIEANRFIIISAMVLDIVVLSAFLWLKAKTDLLIVVLAILFIIVIFICERIFLNRSSFDEK